MTCPIDDCDRQTVARGLCRRHWQRAKRRGEFTPTPRYRDTDDRLQSRAMMTDRGCWEWRGDQTPNGYGSVEWRGQYWVTHRLAYETYVGPIPDGLTLDHLCRNPLCMRPDHLEPVTQRENTLRGTAVTADNARKTHCHRGHEFTAENTKRVTTKYGHDGRACRTCENARARRDRAERVACPVCARLYRVDTLRRHIRDTHRSSEEAASA